MSEREIPQRLLPLWGEANKHLPLIGLTPAALDETTLGEPIDEFDRAVMRDLEPLGQRADGRFPSLRQTFHGQEQLVLLGFKARSTRSLFTEAEKPAKLIAKFSECLIRCDRDLISGIHHATSLPVESRTSYDERTIAEPEPLCQAR
jgi:hypothetical protein